MSMSASLHLPHDLTHGERKYEHIKCKHEHENEHTHEEIKSVVWWRVEVNTHIPELEEKNKQPHVWARVSVGNDDIVIHASVEQLTQLGLELIAQAKDVNSRIERWAQEQRDAHAQI